MCELLVTKGNYNGHLFTREAYEKAREQNPDGAGYILFTPSTEGHYEIESFGTYPARPYYHRGSTFRSRRVSPYSKPVVTNPPATHYHNRDRLPIGANNAWDELNKELQKDIESPGQTSLLDSPKKAFVKVANVLSADGKHQFESFVPIETTKTPDHAKLTKKQLKRLQRFSGEKRREIMEKMIAKNIEKHNKAIEAEKDLFLEKIQQMDHTEKVLHWTLDDEEYAEKNPQYAAQFVEYMRAEGYVILGYEDTDVEADYEYNSALDDRCIDEIVAIQENLTPGQILVVHFRYATSGVTVQENTHPIETENYLVIHNGVFGYDKKSLPKGFNDTRLFANKVSLRAKQMGIGPGNEEGEREMIASLLEEAGGYYSTFIYSLLTKQLYYFKSKVTARFFWDASGLLGATRDTRFPHTIYDARDIILKPHPSYLPKKIKPIVT
jgi:hypothetical protein